MSKEKLFHVGVKALITNRNGKILLLHAGKRFYKEHGEHWDIPGGRIQEGSNLDETLRREVEEETGISKIIASEFFSAVISNHEFTEDGRRMGLVLMVYKVEVPENVEIIISDEHTNYEWVDKKEAAQRLANKYPPEFTNLLK